MAHQYGNKRAAGSETGEGRVDLHVVVRGTLRDLHRAARSREGPVAVAAAQCHGVRYALICGLASTPLQGAATVRPWGILRTVAAVCDRQWHRHSCLSPGRLRAPLQQNTPLPFVSELIWAKAFDGGRTIAATCDSSSRVVIVPAHGRRQFHHASIMAGQGNKSGARNFKLRHYRAGDLLTDRPLSGSLMPRCLLPPIARSRFFRCIPLS